MHSPHRPGLYSWLTVPPLPPVHSPHRPGLYSWLTVPPLPPYPHTPRFVDLPDLVPKTALGPPQLYISHMWSSPFTDMVDQVAAFLAGS